MYEARIVSLAEEVDARVLHLGQFDIQPFLNRSAGQLAYRELGRSSQQELQSDVVILHKSLGAL